eukprot:993261-Rhodomonas_salina.1
MPFLTCKVLCAAAHDEHLWARIADACALTCDAANACFKVLQPVCGWFAVLNVGVYWRRADRCFARTRTTRCSSWTRTRHSSTW